MDDEARALKVCALGNLVFVQLARTGRPLALGMELCNTHWSAPQGRPFVGRWCKDGRAKLQGPGLSDVRKS